MVQARVVAFGRFDCIHIHFEIHLRHEMYIISARLKKNYGTALYFQVSISTIFFLFCLNHSISFKILVALTNRCAEGVIYGVYIIGALFSLHLKLCHTNFALSH